MLSVSVTSTPCHFFLSETSITSAVRVTIALLDRVDTMLALEGSTRTMALGPAARVALGGSTRTGELNTTARVALEGSTRTLAFRPAARVALG